MAIGYALRKEMLRHRGHTLEVGVYGTGNNDYVEPSSVTIECMDCHEVLIDEEQEDD